MDLPRRKPLDEHETLDPAEARPAEEKPATDAITAPAAPPLTWDEAVRECKVELERARRLVEYLETMTAQFERQAQAGPPHAEGEASHFKDE